MHIFYRYLFLYYDKQWSKNNPSIIALITITNSHLKALSVAMIVKKSKIVMITSTFLKVESRLYCLEAQKSINSFSKIDLYNPANSTVTNKINPSIF